MARRHYRLGIVVPAPIAGLEARGMRLPVQPLETMAIIVAIAAIVGSRTFYLAERGKLAPPAAWLGTTGFTFYGGLLAAALAVVVYLWRNHLPFA